jgi:transposase/uncharacterized membrane protein
VREIDDDEGRRLVRIVRRGSGLVVTWRRAQMVLLSAQGMDAAAIASVAFTSKDRVRDVIRNFNADGFSSLYPKYKGGHPPKFTLGQRREIKKLARSKPAEHDLPFSTWSLSKLADFLVAEGVVDDISHEGLRVLLREEGVTFQRLKTWKGSKDPRYAEKKARVEQLYAIADREVTPRSATRSATSTWTSFLARRGIGPVVLSACQLAAASVMLAITLAVTGVRTPHVMAVNVAAIAVLGVIGTGFAYVLNYQIITSEGATIASTVTYLLPVVAIVLGVLVLDESITVAVLAGIALVLAGVALTRRRTKPATDEPQLS